jgi:hypothetical protein
VRKNPPPRFDIASPEGTFWKDGADYRAAVVASANAKLSAGTSLTVVGHGATTASPPLGKTAAFSFRLAGPPVDPAKPYSVAVYLNDGTGQLSGIKTVDLLPVGYKSKPSANPVIINIDKPGMKADKLPLSALTLEQLKVLVGKELRLQIGELSAP